MKKLMYLSISMMCLAITLLIGIHIGSQSVQAQAPEAISGYRVSLTSNDAYNQFVMLSNGDVYARSGRVGDGGQWQGPPMFLGNFWTGSTVPTSPQSLGEIKSQYK